MASFFLLALLLSSTLTFGAKLGDDNSRQRRALVFGGNGFIGTEIVIRLVEENFHVTTTNRGNWYWDSPVRCKTRVHEHFPCDRDDGVLNCWDLRNYIRSVDFFDLVIDLTAYSAKVVADTSKALAGKTGLYVLISSDSVYMVSRRDENKFQDPDDDSSASKADENRPWKEEDSTRPFSATLRERLQEKDPYGHDKLSCEEALVKQREQNGFPYVMLRLPDVLGARDTTNRYWLYQIWMENYPNVQVPIRFSYKMANLKTSFVYIHDVVEAVAAVVRKNNSQVVDKAYNIGFEGGYSLPDLLKAVEKSLKLDHKVEYEFLGHDVEVEESQKPIPGTIYLFPSVDFGYVDITRAKTLLGWQPTPIEDAIANITAFYKHAFGKFPLQRDKAVHTLLYHLPEENKQTLIAVLPDVVKKAEMAVEAEEKKKKDKDEL